MPLHLSGFTLAFELVDVVRLVVEHHQLGQPSQIFQHIAPRITPVQHIQAVARGTTRHQRQHGGHHIVRGQRCAKCFDLFHILQHITLGQQMPVGDGDHPVAGGFQANLVLAAHVAAHKSKHGFAVRIGDKQIGKQCHVGRCEITRAIAARHQLAAESVQQPFVHDQARGHHHELARKPCVVQPLGRCGCFVEQLPDHQRLQHPGLARAGGHLEAVFGVCVFGCRHLDQPGAHQQRIGRGLLVQVQQRGRSQHLVRHDGVQDGLLLSGMEVEPSACVHHVLAEPPLQQLGGGGRDEIQQVGSARLQPQAQLPGLGGQACGQRELVVGLGAHTAPTVVTTSASKPNTSTTRTHTLRGLALALALALALMVTVAVVTTRNSSASLAVLPR